MSKIIETIETHSKFGIKLGLDNIQTVLHQLDNPQDQLSIIHVAGTNGKGSVCSIISSCLQADGYLVGKFCSPYLIDFTEQFLINERCITEVELTKYYSQVMDVAKQVDVELTIYEVSTVIMFLFALENKVDYLILEVGLGGRLDATNVVNPLVTAITNISLDHTQILGTTIAAIAEEKAGIIKPNIPLFTTETNVDALTVFKSHTTFVTQIDSNLKFELNYQTFQTEVTIDENEYCLNLFGVHQVQNFALAYNILKYLKINDAAIHRGARNVVHRGRLQRISSNLIFDGAHNPGSAQMLVQTMSNYQGDINIIFSILKDKDVSAIVRELKKLSTNIVFIPLDNIERGLTISEFEQLEIEGVVIQANLESAIDDSKLNLICGSFSLYPQLEQYLSSRR